MSSHPCEAVSPRSVRELVDYVAEDWRTHGRDISLPGFRAVLIHRLTTYRVHRRGLVGKLLGFVCRTGHRRVRNVYGIELPYSVRLGRRVVFEHQGGIVIHGNAAIGDGCIIRQGVTLGNRHLDDPDSAPALGNGVNVGAGAKILGGIHIGDGAAIGANAVVLHDVPAGGTVVGIPAGPLVRSAPQTPLGGTDPTPDQDP